MKRLQQEHGLVQLPEDGSAGAPPLEIVNGVPVQTYPADSTGYIGVGVFPATAPSPLKFREVSLRNAADARKQGLK